MSDNGKASPYLPTLSGAFAVGSLSARLAHGYML